MKKITFLFTLVCGLTIGFSQTTELLNETFDSALPAEWTNNTNPTYLSETTFGWTGTEGNPAGAMFASGSVDEANGTSEGRAFQFLYNNNAFDYGNSSSVEISFDIRITGAVTNANLQFQTQAARDGGGVVVVNNENIQNGVTQGVWTNLTFNMTPNPSEFDTDGTLLIFFFNLASAPIGGSGGAFEVDNIVVTGTDAAAPTCDDGMQNGDEEGVDCGGASCPPCATDPTDGPGNNGSAGTDFYIYSELSGNPSSSDFAGFNLVDFSNPEAAFSQPDLNGDTVLRVDNLGFFGSGFGENFDATGTYTYVHINYYATTSTAFNFSLVDDSLSATICCGNPEEPFYRFGVDEPLETGQWVSTFIPLSHYATFPALVSGTWDGTDLKQTLFTGNGTVFIDNLYFSTSDTLGVDDLSLVNFKAFPNPTNDNWEILANSEIKNITMYDMLGKQVLSLTPNRNFTTIKGSDLNDGIYFAKIETVSGSETIKLIKD
ncbi:T9SS type A sorting domain-containing protein [Winogradskyella sp. 3972H.M.0a.05]|uniref:T9SS type A sorting domain-containing protein n=1 Tax=Winogradskyella sp. 3972H.M.0a.05 TaxID=2950277 RepID=UPI0033925C78